MHFSPTRQRGNDAFQPDAPAREGPRWRVGLEYKGRLVSKNKQSGAALMSQPGGSGADIPEMSPTILILRSLVVNSSCERLARNAPIAPLQSLQTIPFDCPR
jgi:hypothetical protein